MKTQRQRFRDLLTVAEATARLRLSERTVRAMLADGRLPGVRLVGLRAVRIPASAIEALQSSSALRGRTLLHPRQTDTLETALT
jgi:excisionase family DNA binding protein